MESIHESAGDKKAQASLTASPVPSKHTRTNYTMVVTLSVVMVIAICVAAAAWKAECEASSSGEALAIHESALHNSRQSLCKSRQGAPQTPVTPPEIMHRDDVPRFVAWEGASTESAYINTRSSSFWTLEDALFVLISAAHTQHERGPKIFLETLARENNIALAILLRSEILNTHAASSKRAVQCDTTECAEKVEAMLSTAILHQEDVWNMLVETAPEGLTVNSLDPLTGETFAVVVDPKVLKAMKQKLENAIDWCQLAQTRLKSLLSNHGK